MTQSFLEVTDLTVRTRAGKVLVDNLSFAVSKGETLAIIGESGSARASPAWPSWGSSTLSSWR